MASLFSRGPEGRSSSLAGWPDARVCALLTIAVLVTFWPVLNHDFVNYDDDKYVTANAHVQEGLSASSLAWAFTTFRGGNWHPLTWISHMTDWMMYGSDPSGHHLTNVLLHLANTLVLYLAFRTMTGRPMQSVVVAVLFAVHPLHVESVAWVAERKDVLSALFAFLTLWLYVRHAQRPNTARYVAVAISLALGLMAKPMLVTVPPLLLLLDYWPLRRHHERTWTRLVVEKLPLAALAAASSLVTIAAQHAGRAVLPLEELAFGQRLANAVVAYGAYVWKTVWPANLAVFYPHPEDGLGAGLVMTTGVVLVALTVASVAFRRHAPFLLVGWLWFLGTLVPVIGLVQVGRQAMADRYTYIPLVGLFVMVAWGPLGALNRWLGGAPRYSRRLRTVLVVVATAWLASLAVAARAQVGHWRDSASLFRHALEVTRDNDTAHLNLGLALVQVERAEEAEHHFREALRISPNWAKAHLQLGIIEASRGRPGVAIEHFRAAAASDPEDVDVFYNWGTALLSQGSWREAEERLRRAVEIKPEHAVAHYNLGVALYLQGDAAGARREVLEGQRLGFEPPKDFLRTLDESPSD